MVRIMCFVQDSSEEGTISVVLDIARVALAI